MERTDLWYGFLMELLRWTMALIVIPPRILPRWWRQRQLLRRLGHDLGQWTLVTLVTFLPMRTMGFNASRSFFGMLNGSLYFRKPPYHHSIGTSSDLVSKMGSPPAMVCPLLFIAIPFQVCKFPARFAFGRRIAKKQTMLILVSSIPNFGLWKMSKLIKLPSGYLT